MIRLVLGFFIVFGAVGGMESNPDASLLALTLIAVVGLGLMHFGVKTVGRKYE